ncbi:MAG: response regulator transcription factor [Thermoanaerobaculia bacterium]
MAFRGSEINANSRRGRQPRSRSPRRGPYDLLVLDVGLPDITGFEICQRLRTEGSRVLVLMLTARDAVADRVIGLNAGADDYLTKPFAFDELLARVRALLRRGTVTVPPMIEAGDLLLDTAKREASRHGRVIELTAKEYALLEYLVRNQARVIGREEISEHVWNESFDPVSNLIEVYVARLRKKLGPPALIQTRRGAGYIFANSSEKSSS